LVARLLNVSTTGGSNPGKSVKKYIIKASEFKSEENAFKATFVDRW
jgi:hypothetical protein